MKIRPLDLEHQLLFSFPCSVTVSLASSPPPNPIPPRPLSPNIRRQHLLRCSGRRTGSFSDSNARSATAGRRYRFRNDDFDDGDEDFRRTKTRSWWDDDYDEFDDEYDNLLDENPWDDLWIVKVFRPFGWMLPAIIISMLLSTGPKAFLMALALPLGQTAISLAIDKVWGKTSSGPRPKSKTRKKPFAGASRDVEWEEESSSTDGKQMPGYQTWMATDDGVVNKESNRRQSSFGGWDELDRRGASKGPSRQPRRTRRGPARQRPEKPGKLIRRGTNGGVPLFLRLLIAVFPFLGSWTKLL